MFNRLSNSRYASSLSIRSTGVEERVREERLAPIVREKLQSAEPFNNHSFRIVVGPLKRQQIASLLSLPFAFFLLHFTASYFPFLYSLPVSFLPFVFSANYISLFNISKRTLTRT